MSFDVGFIHLHRKLRNHWVWQDPELLKAWLDLLLGANWQDEARLVRGKLVRIQRGQMLASERFLSERCN